MMELAVFAAPGNTIQCVTGRCVEFFLQARSLSRPGLFGIENEIRTDFVK